MSGSKASVIEKINRMPVSILGKRGRCMRTDEKTSSFARDYNAEALSRLSRMNFFFLLSMPQT